MNEVVYQVIDYAIEREETLTFCHHPGDDGDRKHNCSHIHYHHNELVHVFSKNSISLMIIF